MSEKEHELKTWPSFFGTIISGHKRFEIRKDDRGFRIGDCLRLREWHPDLKEYTGEEVLMRVTTIVRGFGLKDGYCVMGVRRA